MNQRLLTLMRLIYRRYTGQEIAEAIRHIRQELEQERQLKNAQEEIARLNQRVDLLQDLSGTAHRVAGVPVPKSSKSRTKLDPMV